MIQHEQELGRRSRLERCNTVAGSLFGAGENPLGFGSYWRSASQQLATLVDCDGVALVGQERVNRYGSCPADHVIQTIVASSLDQNGSGYPGGMGANVTVTNSFLADVAHVDAAPSAGAITLLDPLPAFDALVFFRDETSETVRWAGTTEKKLVDAADGLRLNPRASFDEYLDSTAGRCRSWEQTDIDMVDALGQALQRYYASQELREQHQGELGLVVRELNHRVRNILAVVKSLIGQTSGQAADLPGYVQSLEERIAALAGAHDLLTENDWKTIGFDELCRRSLRPYLGEDQNRVAISGEPVRVIARVASAMSLVLHELASNAAKYGALSVPSGRVVVRWTLTNDSLSLQWTEQGGPAVREPSSVGFGTSIIRDSLSFEFDASSTLFFAPSGVEARFVLPASLVEGCAEPGIPEISVESEDSAAPEVRRVLLLEDDYIVSCETKAMIERCTESAVSVTPSIEAAFTAIKHQRFDAAVLDVNIRGEFSGPVAERLAADGVPFVFATGYGSRDQQLQDFGAREILTKPILEPRLATVLADLLADQPGGEEI
jgi:two-component sensor histidine kinase/ActR/RegA family two-component response regulator